METVSGERIQAEMRRARDRIEDLTAEVQAIGESAAGTAADDEHDAEGSTIGFERARVSALLALAQAHLADLAEALDRANAGIYGFCATCGARISAERLEALPATRTCRACASGPGACIR